jgi:putative sterol carrier protein
MKYLSDEYMEAATTELNANSDFLNAITNVTMGLQFHVTEAPAGEIDYYLNIADGAATMATGALDGADVSITSTYETTVALANGELNTQMAFMTGKIKVSGNMAVLMMNQGVIDKWGSALGGIAVDF